jgi:hypothetical protein
VLPKVWTRLSGGVDQLCASLTALLVIAPAHRWEPVKVSPFASS